MIDKMDIKIKVYKFLQTIPYSKVISYQTIADKFDINPRYVGKIMNQNKNPDIYPCYKVVRSDWNLWWYNWWSHNKIKRLKSDWIQIMNNKIDKKYFR